jgi:hypothetical protein
MFKSYLARKALFRFLAVSEFQRLRAKLVGRAQAQGVHGDDDVFRILGKSSTTPRSLISSRSAQFKASRSFDPGTLARHDQVANRSKAQLFS